MLIRNCTSSTTWGLPTYDSGEVVLRPGQSGDADELDYTTAILLKVGDLKIVEPEKSKPKKEKKPPKPSKVKW